MTHLIDYDKIRARMEEQRQREEAFAQALRGIARTSLTRIGAVSVDAMYNGEADSGGIETISLDAQCLHDTASIEVELDVPDPWQQTGTNVGRISLHRVLDMLFMSIVCSRHPGRETSGGGYGEITWELAEDVIQVNHTTVFTDTEHDSFEA